MLALKLLLNIAGALLLAAAVAIPLYALWLHILKTRRNAANAESIPPETANIEPLPQPIPWRTSVTIALAACAPLLLAAGIVVVPSGTGGVRISQLRGTLPGTLYPGTHFVAPLVTSVQTYDLRDHLFTAGIIEEGGRKSTASNLTVQSSEGLNIGLGITVRYRLDPSKLSTVEARLPQPADKQIVPPSSRAPGVSSRPSTPCARSSPPNAKKSAIAPPALSPPS